MDRRKILIAYELAAIVPLVAISVVSMVLGVPVVATVPGLICSIALLLACLFAVHTAMKRKVSDSLDKYVNMYNNGCDPDAFMRAGGKMAYNMMQEREKGDKLSAPDAWYLSLYALASIDMGETKSAEDIAAAILEDVNEQKADVDKASMLVNLEPLVLRMRGVDEALMVIDKINGYIEGDDSGQAQDIRGYINFESKVLNAMAEGDTETVKNLFELIYHNQAQPMRLRVMGADTVASICRANGDTDGEIVALTFVEEHGNKLPVVAPASERIFELF